MLSCEIELVPLYILFLHIICVYNIHRYQPYYDSCVRRKCQMEALSISLIHKNMHLQYHITHQKILIIPSYLSNSLHDFLSIKGIDTTRPQERNTTVPSLPHFWSSDINSTLLRPSQSHQKRSIHHRQSTISSTPIFSADFPVKS